MSMESVSLTDDDNINANDEYDVQFIEAGWRMYMGQRVMKRQTITQANADLSSTWTLETNSF